MKRRLAYVVAMFLIGILLLTPTMTTIGIADEEMTLELCYQEVSNMLESGEITPREADGLYNSCRRRYG